MKPIVAEWFATQNESRAFFADLRKILGGEKLDVDVAINGTHLGYQPNFFDKFFPVEGSLIISDYLKNYEELSGLDAFGGNCVVADDLAVAFHKLEKFPVVSVVSSPFLRIANSMVERGFWGKSVFFREGPFFAEMQRLQLERSVKVVVPSLDMADYVREIGYRGEVEVFSYVPDLDWWCNAFGDSAKLELAKEFGFPLDKPIGVVLTRFDPVVNFGLLRDIIVASPNVFWVVLLEGFSPRPPKLGNVRFFEWPSEDLKRKLFNVAHFYVGVDEFDYRNITALQCMACDLPIIVPKRGYFSNWKKFISVELPENDNLEVTDFGFVIGKPNLPDYLEAIRETIQSVYEGKLYEFQPRDHFDAHHLNRDEYIFKWNLSLNNLFKKL